MQKLHGSSANGWMACLIVAAWLVGGLGPSPVLAARDPATAKSKGFAGSVSCRECHERFYQLWSGSRHGLAMQPYTVEFAQRELTPQKGEIKIGKSSYRADISGSTGYVREREAGSSKKYRIEHVLGGKNVYYFLTPLGKGRLQTLPMAYDVQRKEWFDTAASGIRHFPGGQTGLSVDWKDPAYTFNTSCHGCHVSQLTTNYDLRTDTYSTTWAEPGINCEACHGPSEEHNRILRQAPKGQEPEDMRILSWKGFTPEQKNDACSICHAKVYPVTAPPSRREIATLTTSISPPWRIRTSIPTAAIWVKTTPTPPGG